MKIKPNIYGIIDKKYLPSFNISKQFVEKFEEHFVKHYQNFPSYLCIKNGRNVGNSSIFPIICVSSIGKKSEFENFGVTLDCKLTRNPHMNNILNKATKVFIA